MRSTASTLVNAQLSYRVAKPLLLTVDVFNVFDAQVDDIAYYYPSLLRGEKPPAPGSSRSCPVTDPFKNPPPPCGVEDVHFHPAEKRSVRLTASVFF